MGEAVRRIWFIIVPAALFVWVLVYGDIQLAVFLALVSFVLGASAFLLALRMNWRWDNPFATFVACAGVFLIFLYAVYENNGRFANTSEPVEVELEPCPPDGCKMILFEPESEFEDSSCLPGGCRMPMRPHEPVLEDYQ